MVYTAPEHYSYKFKFNIEKLPAVQKDRIPARLACWGMVCGLLFILLGGFELTTYFFEPVQNEYEFKLPDSSFPATDVIKLRYVFAAIMLFLGILVETLAVMSLFRYKKIFFDGERIKIIHRPLFGEKRVETENLYNYLGVLLKVEYYQLGLINRNRYIIELFHRDKNKRVPLYISTSGRNVRKIWEYYAEKLRMPALFMTDKGLVSRHYTELNRTLKGMAKKWQLKSLLQSDENMPDSVKCIRKNNKTVLKERRLFFDVYSVLAFLGVVILGSLMAYAVLNAQIVLKHTGILWFSAALALCLALITVSLIIIFSKDVLVATKQDIVLGHNILFLRMNAAFLPKDEIEAVDIGHNPVTDRFYLSIITHERNMVFGKNMPVADLRWVRGFIIREIVKD